MATWMVHCRIADYFLNKLDIVYNTEFAIGNFAPDCGYGRKDSFGEFEPPPEITHFSPSGTKRDCRYKDFYNKYLNEKKKTNNYYFYLGYYIHLLTDILWSAQMCVFNKIKCGYEDENEFIKCVKPEWNNLDIKYFKEHADILSYNLIESAKIIPDYLPYYEKGQLKKQIQFIVNYYKNEPYIIKEGFKYITEKSIDEFINDAVGIIEKELKKKELV